MNERIKELAEQAGLYDEKSPDEVPEFTASFEKFAELIVRECLVVVESNIYGPYGEYDSSYSDADAAADSRAQSIHDDIKYRFGVEE